MAPVIYVIARAKYMMINLDRTLDGCLRRQLFFFVYTYINTEQRRRLFPPARSALLYYIPRPAFVHFLTPLFTPVPFHPCLSPVLVPVSVLLLIYRAMSLLRYFRAKGKRIPFGHVNAGLGCTDSSVSSTISLALYFLFSSL